MVYRMFTILAVLTLVLCGSVFAQDPGIPDTLRIDSIQVDPGDPAVVDLSFYNDQAMASLQIPLTWSSPDITLDSVSYVGSRVDYIASKLYNLDNPNQKVLAVVIVLFEEDIPAGDGLFARLYFNIPTGTPDQIVYLDTLSYTPVDNPLFITALSESYPPILKTGKIVIGEPSDPPTIATTPSSFTFEAMAEDATPSPQVLNVDNIGGGVLNWTADWDATWLNVLPPNGAVAPGPGQNVQIAINTTSLAPGVYNEIIVISDPNATNDPVEVEVQYTVIEPPPTITLSSDQFIFNGLAGGTNPADQFLDITNTGYGVLEWTASNDSSWLTLSPTSGTGPGTVTLSIDITGLPYGTYYDTITVSDPAATNDPQYAEVRLDVASDLPIIAIDTSFFFINVIDPVNTPGRTFSILNAGGGSMNFTLSESSPRITALTPSTGTVPQVIDVTIKTTGGSPGDEYEDTIWVSSAEAINSPQPVVFHFLWTSNPDQFIVNVTSLSAEYYECGQGIGGGITQPAFMSIVNNNNEPLDFDLIWDAEWFDMGVTSATTPAFFNPQFDYCGMAPGIYYDTLVLYAPSAINHPLRIPLTLTILPTEDTPEIYVDKDSLYIIARINTVTVPQVIKINNVNPGCMDWALTENISWLESGVDSSNCKTYPWFLHAGANTNGLPIGQYTDIMTITSNTASNAPVDIDVVLDVWSLKGDCDWNGTINILDIIWMIENQFFSGPDPMPGDFIGDVNCDGQVNVVDIILMIDYEFNDSTPFCGNESK